MRNAFVGKLVEHAKQDKNIVLLSGDLGYNVLNRFWELMPERYFNAGIAEQNLMGVAAGLALAGKKVSVVS